MREPPPKGTVAYDEWAAEDKGPTILALCWTFVGLATLFMVARLYVRLYIFRQLRSDDYWCIAGTICAYISSAMTVCAVHSGNGQHYQILSVTQQEDVRFWTLAAFCPGVLCFGFPKFAVVALLTRLMNPSRWHRWFLWGMVTWCLLTLFATMGTLLGQCTPTRAMWNFDMEKHCVDPKHIVNFSLYAGAMSAFVDIYLAVYPALVLFKLQMKLKKKLALTAALSIGCVGGAIAIYKTTRIPDGLNSPDFSYDSADLVNWTIIEGSTIIIAASIPVLSPLMDKLLRGRNPFASTPKNSSSKQQHYYPSGLSNSLHHHRNSSLGGKPGHSMELQSGSSPRRKTRSPLGDLDATTTVANSSEECLTPKKDTFYHSSSDVESQRAVPAEQAWQREAVHGHSPPSPARRYHNFSRDSASSQSSSRTQVPNELLDGDSHLVPAPLRPFPHHPPSSPTQGIVRTSEVIVESSYGNADQEVLNRNIPWETVGQRGNWPLQ